MILVAFVVGLVGASVAWRATRPTFEDPRFLRENYRGRLVPTGVGVLLAIVAIAGDALFALLASADVEGTGIPFRPLVLVTALGFGLLGLFDDVGGTGSDRGFAGHVRALRQGRLTTGGLKLLGGGALTVAVAGAVDGTRFDRLVVDALLIALAANLGNLFDRAPGRVTKVTLLAFVAVLAAAGIDEEALVGVAVVVGAGVGLLVPDLREDLMLGDAGANVLGAVVGLGVVLTATPFVRGMVLLVVAGLNLTSEVVSFSRVIDRVPPLRTLDRLGRRPD
jgi:UDP-GlcNAc:undecaprenyl-phosphate GlcNAc-1-phosphate transferase